MNVFAPNANTMGDVFDMDMFVQDVRPDSPTLDSLNGPINKMSVNNASLAFANHEQPVDYLDFLGLYKGCQITQSDLSDISIGISPPCPTYRASSPTSSSTSSNESGARRPRASRGRIAPPSSPKTTKSSSATCGTKIAHSAVERKYRENLNAKMNQLQQALLGTEYLSREGSQLLDDVSGAKLRKAHLLASTIDYIEQAEIDKRHMSHEIKLLQSKLAALERQCEYENCVVWTQPDYADWTNSTSPRKHR